MKRTTKRIAKAFVFAMTLIGVGVACNKVAKKKYEDGYNKGYSTGDHDGKETALNGIANNDYSWADKTMNIPGYSSFVHSNYLDAGIIAYKDKEELDDMVGKVHEEGKIVSDDLVQYIDHLHKNYGNMTILSFVPNGRECVPFEGYSFNRKEESSEEESDEEE